MVLTKDKSLKRSNTQGRAWCSVAEWGLHKSLTSVPNSKKRKVQCLYGTLFLITRMGKELSLSSRSSFLYRELNGRPMFLLLRFNSVRAESNGEFWVNWESENHASPSLSLHPLHFANLWRSWWFLPLKYFSNTSGPF